MAGRQARVGERSGLEVTNAGRRCLLFKARPSETVLRGAWGVERSRFRSSTSRPEVKRQDSRKEASVEDQVQLKAMPRVVIPGLEATCGASLVRDLLLLTETMLRTRRVTLVGLDRVLVSRATTPASQPLPVPEATEDLAGTTR